MDGAKRSLEQASKKRGTNSVHAIALAVLLFLHGCGQDGTVVWFVSINFVSPGAAVLFVGDSTFINVGVAFDRPTFQNSNVFVVVKLDPALQYRRNTSELQGDAGSRQIGVRLTNCPAGESYLEYQVSSSDLASISAGSGSARLRLGVDAISRAPSARVEAKTDMQSSSFACGQPVFSDTGATLTVN